MVTSSSPSSPRYDVFVMAGNNLVERGQFWTGGAGLSIAIEDEGLRAQVEGAVRFLIAETAALSANLECGWEVFVSQRKGGRA